MGAAWRSPKDRDIPKVAAMIREVKALGLETCATLGMLSDAQAHALKDAGLDYYNHNLDTAPEFYGEIIHTREFQDRLDTLAHVRDAGMKTCCGGIVGMGESREQRAGLLQTLANLPAHPDSVPINRLVQVAGTPLAGTAELDPFEFVRTIAVARILMPQVDGAAVGRRARSMSDELQALCFARRRQLDLLRREAADHRQSGHRARPWRCSRASGLRPMPVARRRAPTTTMRVHRACRDHRRRRARGLTAARIRSMTRLRAQRAQREARGARARVAWSTRRDGVRCHVLDGAATGAGWPTSAATITSACRSSSR